MQTDSSSRAQALGLSSALVAGIHVFLRRRARQAQP